MRGRRGDWSLLFVLWAVFIVIGELLAWKVDLLPGNYAREGEVVDEAYILLIALAVPVFAGVAATLLTMMVRHTTWKLGDAPPTEDGRYLPHHRTLTIVWVTVSALLAAGVAVNPGFVGLRDFRGEQRADHVIAVQAQRWSWQFTYENGAVATDELVLPVDERIRFDLSSIDIVHSFWIPAFRVKLDNVPGRTTQLYVTPEREGDYADNFNLRIQCAELCGLDHAKMAVPVRVVSGAEFDRYLNSLRTGV
ncbi:MAG: cytochrome c oxidase subunit II [Acidimicrobiia bacterium]